MLGGVRDYSRGVVAHLNICNLFSERRLGRRSGFVVAPCYVSFNRSVMVEMSNSGMAVHISALSVLETRLLVQSMTSHGRQRRSRVRSGRGEGKSGCRLMSSPTDLMPKYRTRSFAAHRRPSGGLARVSSVVLLMTGILSAKFLGARSDPTNRVQNGPKPPVNGSISLICGSAQFGKKP